MNREFKSQFHAGGDKTIVTMGVKVNNSKLFKSLTNEKREALISTLVDFIGQVQAFTSEQIGLMTNEQNDKRSVATDDAILTNDDKTK